MLHLVTYDIVNNRRRTRIAKCLKDFGSRVQFSVFECIMNSKIYGRMVSRVNTIIEKDTDSVRIYRLCSTCKKSIKIIGQGEVTADADHVIL